MLVIKGKTIGGILNSNFIWSKLKRWSALISFEWNLKKDKIRFFKENSSFFRVDSEVKVYGITFFFPLKLSILSKVKIYSKQKRFFRSSAHYFQFGRNRMCHLGLKMDDGFLMEKILKCQNLNSWKKFSSSDEIVMKWNLIFTPLLLK